MIRKVTLFLFSHPGFAYISDAGLGGLIVYDANTNMARRCSRARFASEKMHRNLSL